MRRQAAALVAMVVLGVAAASADAGDELYNSYACTLQGTPGLTYVIEATTNSEVHGACLAFKRVLGQTQLRWGLHPPSFSSDESWKATWINRKLRVKLNMLARPLPAVPALIKAVGAILSKDWKRSGMSYP